MAPPSGRSDFFGAHPKKVPLFCAPKKPKNCTETGQTRGWAVFFDARRRTQDARRTSHDAEVGGVEVADAGFFGRLFELGDREVLVVGDSLLGNSQAFGDRFVGPAEDE
jgi:hypothetical protein